MGARVAVCVEEEACKNPQIIGLEGERFDSQPWLDVFTTGEEVRRAFSHNGGASELWVVSCDDVEPINLAATIKEDRPDTTVRLVTSDACGSLLSRAHSAGIDEVIDFRRFLNRYAQEKRERGSAVNVVGGAGEAGGTNEAVGVGREGAAVAAGELRAYGGEGAAGEADVVKDDSATGGVLSEKADGRPRRAEDPIQEPGFECMVEGADCESEDEFSEGSARELAGMTEGGCEKRPVNSLGYKPAVVSADELGGKSSDKPEVGPAVDCARETVVGPIELVVTEQGAALPTAQLLKAQPVPVLASTATDNRAFVITVVSGSGGAGKSAVSALGALIASRWGYKTLLFDCDLQFGDVAPMVGAEDPLCVDEALLHPERLEIEAAQAKPLSVLAAPTRLEASEEIVPRLPGLLDAVSSMFEVVVVNTGASWAEQHAMLLERSSVALFLIDQRVSSVRACRHALELCARCGIAANPFQYALNRCAKGAPLSALDVSSALQGVPLFELKEGGRDVEDYLSGGVGLDLIEQRNEFAKSLERVFERLLPGGMRVIPEQPQGSEEKRTLRRRMRHVAGKRGKRQ